MTYRILVTGSRTWDDENTIRQAIGGEVQFHGPENTIVVHGAARGADSLANMIARTWGGGMRVETWRADWDRYGKRAGYVRNAAMVEAGADVCLAFIAPCTKPACRKPQPHGSHGATDCAELAEKAGIPVKPFTSEPSSDL